MALTEKQKRFCDEYLIDLNAEAAAIRSGYSPRYARGNAHKLVAHSGIKEYIKTRMEEKKSELIANQDEVLQYLTSVMRGESRAHEIVVEGTGDGTSEARVMEKPPSEKEKIKAAELLGNRYGAFKDQGERELKKQKTEQEIERLKQQNNDSYEEDDGVNLIYD